MTIINLTPHPITLRDADGVDHVFPSAGVARTASTPGVLGTVPGIPVPVASPTTYGEVVGLPEPRWQCDVCGAHLGEPVCGDCDQHGMGASPRPVWFIVSAIVGAALKGSRPDVLCPGTGPADGAIRENGQVVAVTRLVRS